MGWRSTMNITREDALVEITKRLERTSDKNLAAALLDICGDSCPYNFIIVSDYNQDDCPFPFQFKDHGLPDFEDYQ